MLEIPEERLHTKSVKSQSMSQIMEDDNSSVTGGDNDEEEEFSYYDEEENKSEIPNKSEEANV